MPASTADYCDHARHHATHRRLRPVANPPQHRSQPDSCRSQTPNPPANSPTQPIPPPPSQPNERADPRPLQWRVPQATPQPKGPAAAKSPSRGNPRPLPKPLAPPRARRNPRPAKPTRWTNRQPARPPTTRPEHTIHSAKFGKHPEPQTSQKPSPNQRSHQHPKEPTASSNQRARPKVHACTRSAAPEPLNRSITEH